MIRLMTDGPSPRARGAAPAVAGGRAAAGTIPACAGSSTPTSRTSSPHQDHPRVRGEQEAGDLDGGALVGPSPRARGAGSCCAVGAPCCGTIPACAGSRLGSTARTVNARDHPRVRGEQPGTSIPAAKRAGPSPRARGAVARPMRKPNLEGTIPACAGSSPTHPARRSGGRDHPRVRGEQLPEEQRVKDRLGPSPRARGAAERISIPAGGTGTIPACAGSRCCWASRSGRTRDHPRVRGEQDLRKRHGTTCSGPSPRARGAVFSRNWLSPAAGTIPACAGSRPPGRPRCRGAGDHPRVRGEQEIRLRPESELPGPSPRARGAAPLTWRGVRPAGTIPACAGSRSSSATCPLTDMDHPRVRGEQAVHRVDAPSWRGPSPRARGAVDQPPFPAQLRGTIPACAGSRRTSRRARSTPRDHPRVRGEQHRAVVVVRSSTGPSPHARGAGPRCPRWVRGSGTIPACAGSSGAGSGRRAGARDHPRVRGEQCTPRAAAVFLQGPSPRARGAEHPRLRGRRHGGTIPACAGSRSSASSTPRSTRDHPRVRGEQPEGQDEPQRWLGPSPRARGAEVRRVAQHLLDGTIPACAGSRSRSPGAKAIAGDHPRVRGEQAGRSDCPADHRGPSPRARGAVGSKGKLIGCEGTIPACAGSRSATWSKTQSYGDHPRVRGEQNPIRTERSQMPGPSPRARGAADSHLRPSMVLGTIPACAGSRESTVALVWTQWDHPRVRGEQPDQQLCRELNLGPSPRARGAGRCRCPARSGSGTIPACAGSRPSSTPTTWSWRDHPRVRGEQTASSMRPIAYAGPSPRARGAAGSRC